MVYPNFWQNCHNTTDTFKDTMVSRGTVVLEGILFENCLVGKKTESGLGKGWKAKEC